jgi:hypothetical protein
LCDRVPDRIFVARVEADVVRRVDTLLGPHCLWKIQHRHIDAVIDSLHDEFAPDSAASAGYDHARTLVRPQPVLVFGHFLNPQFGCHTFRD